MSDTTVKKVSSATSPRGKMGQVYLTSGKHVSMRLWREEPPGEAKPAMRRDYETVGYVIAGRAELTLEGQTLRLEPGDAGAGPGRPRVRRGRHRLPATLARRAPWTRSCVAVVPHRGQPRLRSLWRCRLYGPTQA